MDAMMTEPIIGIRRPDVENEEQIVDLRQMSDAAYAIIEKTDDLIKRSMGRRAVRNFADVDLSQAIEILADCGSDTEQYLLLVSEKLKCDSNAVLELGKEDIRIAIYDYAYDSVDSWKSSEGYQIFEKLQDTYKAIGDATKRNELLNDYRDVKEQVADPLEKYYAALENSSEIDVVILYEGKYKDQAIDLLNEMTEMDQYSVEAFRLNGSTAYASPELLAAMRTSSLMICFCQSAEDAEKSFLTVQYTEMKSEEEKKLLFVTEAADEKGDIPTVSMSSEDWASEVGNMASRLINDGTASKKALIDNLTLREKKIQGIIDQPGRSSREIEELIDLINDQLNDIDEYRILYDEEYPCRYDSEDLEEIASRYSGEKQGIEGNVRRWLGKIERDDKAINAILNNTHPKRFYERYLQLCKLIDAQQEHRDKLLATGMTMDQLSARLKDGVEIDRLKLHSKRWEYQSLFKETILIKYMLPFDKEFERCRAVDSIKPLKIDSHIENFEKFEACGIYLKKTDGLTYWTKHAFNHALNEKKHDQIILDSQLERIIDMSADIEHFVRDYYNPTFSADVLSKKAEHLKSLVRSFEKTWGFKLVNKKQIYGGYKGKMCFAKYVDEDLLNRDVSEAIELNSNVNLSELIKEYKSRSISATEFCSLGYSYFNQYKETKSEDLIVLANDYLKKAADMGDRKAQYRLASNYERGIGFTQNMDIALAYYRMSADNNYTDAQYRLARYYESQDEKISLEWYTKAASQKHPNFNACIYLGNYYGKSDKVEDKKQAVHYFLLAKDYMPKDGSNRENMYKYRPCYLLGMDYMNKKNYTEAISWFERIADEDILPAVYCGDCYLMLGKRKEAVEKYLGVEADRLPDDRKIVVADYLLEDGKIGEAYGYYSRCKNVDTDPKLKGRVADCYYANDDVDGAIRIYKECIEETGDPSIKKKLADVWYDRGNYTDALTNYLECSTEFFYDDTVTERIGDCYREEQEDEKAFETYMKCLDVITDVNKLEFVCEMLIKGGRNKEAFGLFEQLIGGGEYKKIPEGIISYVREYNKWDRLSAWYSEYGCTLPDVSLLIDLGNYYRLSGDVRAVECYEKYADEGSLTDTGIINYMIRYYKGTESPERAEKWIDRRNEARRSR